MRTLGSLRSRGCGRVIAELGRKAGQTFLNSFAPRRGGGNHHLGNASVAGMSVGSVSCADLTRSDGGHGPDASRRRGSRATVGEAVSVRVPMRLG